MHFSSFFYIIIYCSCSLLYSNCIHVIVKLYQEHSCTLCISIVKKFNKKIFSRSLVYIYMHMVRHDMTIMTSDGARANKIHVGVA